MNYPYTTTIELADIPLQVHMHFHEVLNLFSRYAVNSEPKRELYVSEADWEVMKGFGFSFDAQSEGSILTSLCSDILLDYDRCILHGVALRFRDRAFLIVAEPGVGKSTQAKTLQELYPGEFSIICGDRPVLKKTGDSFLVCPSPWNGKEDWYGAEEAPLAAVIVLSRGRKNSVSLLSERKAVMPVYSSLIYTGSDQKQIRKAAGFAESIIRSIPVWDFVNQDVPDSSKLLYETVFQKEGL